MSKNIIIIILSVLLIASLYYGYRQNGNADELVSACENEKAELTKLAEEQQKRASTYQDIAARAQQEAMIQRTICEEQLKALKKK